jgi:hypothetical protein
MAVLALYRLRCSRVVCTEGTTSYLSLPVADATWMDLEEFKRLYMEFQLKDEMIVQDGRDVMWRIPYACRKKKAQTQASTNKEHDVARSN